MHRLTPFALSNHAKLSGKRPITYVMSEIRPSSRGRLIKLAISRPVGRFDQHVEKEGSILVVRISKSEPARSKRARSKPPASRLIVQYPAVLRTFVTVR